MRHCHPAPRFRPHLLRAGPGQEQGRVDRLDVDRVLLSGIDGLHALDRSPATSRATAVGAGALAAHGTTYSNARCQRTAIRFPGCWPW